MLAHQGRKPIARRVRLTFSDLIVKLLISWLSLGRGGSHLVYYCQWTFEHAIDDMLDGTVGKDSSDICATMDITIELLCDWRIGMEKIYGVQKSIGECYAIEVCPCESAELKGRPCTRDQCCYQPKPVVISMAFLPFLGTVRVTIAKVVGRGPSLVGIWCLSIVSICCALVYVVCERVCIIVVIAVIRVQGQRLLCNMSMGYISDIVTRSG